MRRSIISLTIALFACAAGIRLWAGGEVIILDYHSFLGSGSSSLDYSLADMGAQLDRIRALGYTFVSLDDAIAGRIEGTANVVITIDDGNRSDYEAYKRVFEERGIKPELFIYPFPIGRSRHALTPEQLKELAGDGCGIGAHGFFHEYMTARAYERDPAKVMMEVTRPAPALRKLVGERPRLFAYPFGFGCPPVSQALREAGYDWAFTAGDKIKSVDFSDPRLDHFNVPRTIVYHWNRAQIFSYLATRQGLARSSRGESDQREISLTRP
ncbi:MAG: polysaccharide deacetylase family protein [Treponema sp.]|nr:polysaccharide deacetylase family protein [Treponema sp.]